MRGQLTRIAGDLQVRTDLTFPGSPHSPVIVRVNALAARKRAMILVRPKALPLDRPIGCSLSPPAVVKEGVLLAARRASRSDTAAFDNAFSAVIEAAEKEFRKGADCG